MGQTLRGLTIGLSLGLSAGCPGGAQDVNPHVILITWDTTRDDSLSSETAPHFTRLASEGVRFLNARTSVPLTLPAHATMFTGQYPHEHGVRVNGFHHLEEDAQTLAESFKAAGYATGAFVSAAVLEEEYGLAQGFDHYDDQMNVDSAGWYFPERSGKETLSAAKQWASGLEDQSAFMWIHLFEPHRPWTPSEAAQQRHAFPYDGEIWDVDQITHDFLGSLERTGMLSKSLVVLTSDHGEGLGEHGEWTHGSLIYDSTMRVPLVFWAGDETGLTLNEGHQSAEAVSHVDIAATLEGLLPIQMTSTSGVDLGPALRGQELPEKRDVLMETGDPAYLYDAAPLFGVVQDQDVWIDSPIAERYDLSTDPGQILNHYDSVRDGPRLEALRNAHPRSGEDLLPSRELSSRQVSQLEALGYVSTPIVELPTDDIKTRLEMMAMVQSGAIGFSLQEIEEQLERWEQLWGPLVPLQKLRLLVFDTQGRQGEGDAYLTKIGSTSFLESRQEERREQLALIKAIRATLEREPDHPTAHADLAITLWRTGQPKQARPLFEEALEREVGNVQVYLDAIRFYVGQSDPARAMEILKNHEAAVEGLPVDWICLRARLWGLLKRDAEHVSDLTACAEGGGELGLSEMETLGVNPLEGVSQFVDTQASVPKNGPPVAN